MRALVIGLGYVGLPLAVRAAEAGHFVVGIDLDKGKITSLNNGTSYIEDVGDGRLREVMSTSNLMVCREVGFGHTTFDIAIITVPTPLNSDSHPDLSYVEAAGEAIGRVMQQGSAVVLESTTYPGTTEGLLKDVLEKFSRMQAGVDFHLGFSPERIDPGPSEHTLENTPKLVSATTPEGLEFIRSFYDTIVDTTVPVSSPRVAELAKVFENTQAYVNIALVNEIAEICHTLKIDVHEMIDAAMTKGHSVARWTPGPGVGGHSSAPGTLVLTEHGMRVIESIKVGDRVVASDGKLHPVLKVHAHDYDGAMIVLRSRGMPEVRLTTEHKVPVAMDSRPLRARAARKGLAAGLEREGWREFLASDGTITSAGLAEPEFVEASTIAPNLHWMYWPTVTEDSAVEVPELVTDDYIRLAGWYVSEGSTSWRRGKPHTVTFGLHTDEIEYQQEIATLLGIVGDNSHVGFSVYPKRHSHVVRYHSIDLAPRLVADFGQYQHDRIIPNWLLFGPEKNIGPFLRGLLCGDAWLSPREAQLSTTSQNVAYGTVILLNRLGIPSRVKERNRKNRRLAYEVIVRGVTNLATLYETIDVGIPIDDISDPLMYPTRDGRVYRRLQSVHSEPYTGTVHDITVEDDHTFVTPAGVVSNCLPIDPLYLTWQSRNKFGKTLHLTETAHMINSKRPEYVASRAYDMLSLRGIPMFNASVLVMGLAYKPDVSDVRESPVLPLIQSLLTRGALVTVVDPWVEGWTRTPMVNIEELAGSIENYDLVIVATNHSIFDYNKVVIESKQVLDCRNSVPSAENVVRL